MPDFEDGVTALIVSLVGGLALSYIISGFLGTAWASLFNILSILFGLMQLERAKYWGVSYTLGYFGGLLLFGGYFMESWEYPIYILVIGAYIALKFLKKIR